MSTIKGKAYTWRGLRVSVIRVARNGKWADIRVTGPNGNGWSKRQPLPFPADFQEAGA